VNPASFPTVEELVPHSDSMLLLDWVLEHESDFTICSATADSGAHFADPGGSVPSWVSLEYMAQCAAVHGGLADRNRDKAPRPGLLLGSRRLLLHTDTLPTGQELHVTARHHRASAGLVAFDCSIRSETTSEILAEGRINIYILEDWGELEEARA
jgi:predicted hotdog family 3-hydroxylacyl-ACP dehydratase